MNCVTYHYNGTTELRTDDRITHRFPPGRYELMLMLKLNGKHRTARAVYRAAELKENGMHASLMGELMQNCAAGFNAALALIHAAEMVFKHKD